MLDPFAETLWLKQRKSYGLIHNRPRVIGLDIYRDFPVSLKYRNLII